MPLLTLSLLTTFHGADLTSARLAEALRVLLFYRSLYFSLIRSSAFFLVSGSFAAFSAAVRSSLLCQLRARRRLEALGDVMRLTSPRFA